MEQIIFIRGNFESFRLDIHRVFRHEKKYRNFNNRVPLIPCRSPILIKGRNQRKNPTKTCYLTTISSQQNLTSIYDDRRFIQDVFLARQIQT